MRSSYTRMALAISFAFTVTIALAAPAQYREALKIAPESADALANLGNALVSKNQFDEAIRRARDEIVEASAENGDRDREHDSAEQKPRYWSRLAIKDHDRFILLKAEEVSWVGSATNYSEVHAGNRSYLLRIPISDLETKLDPLRFARISRSAIVRVEEVQEIKTLWHGDFEVVLKDGTVLRMSRRYRDRLLSHG